MIKTNTVFVLGAGASEPYRLPLGSELVDQVTAEIRNAHPIVRRMEQLGYESQAVIDFSVSLSQARPYSIDAFLEMRPEFRELGKATIADVLLRAENQDHLEAAASHNDWYRYLFNRYLVLKGRQHYLDQAKLLTIVTFNFDRSFERALFLSLRANFGLTDSDASKLARELPVYHLHGSLGDPDWLFPESENRTKYGHTDSDVEEAVLSAVRSIRIVDEEVVNSSVLLKANTALNAANYVYFIGFGFDPRNLEKLGTPESVREATHRATTAYRWSNAERAPVGRHFGAEKPINIYDCDAIGFMREYAVALYQ